MGQRIVRIQFDRLTKAPLGLLPLVFAGANRGHRAVALGQPRVEFDGPFRRILGLRVDCRTPRIRLPTFRSMAINASAIPAYAMA